MNRNHAPIHTLPVVLESPESFDGSPTTVAPTPEEARCMGTDTGDICDDEPVAAFDVSTTCTAPAPAAHIVSAPTCLATSGEDEGRPDSRDGPARTG